MPNIELHGFSSMDADIKKAAIFNMFAKEACVKDMVVTTFANEVVDLNGAPQPFIRVTSTPNQHIDKIVKKLRSLGIDIEVLILKAFHPK